MTYGRMNSLTAAEKLQFTVPSRMILSNEEYHAHPAIGSSSIKDILRSPAHFKYARENKDEPTPAMRFGTACHTAILEPKEIKNRIVVKPKFEGTGARTRAEQWALENHGKEIVTAEQMADIFGIIESLKRHKTAMGALAGGRPEESFFDQCPDTGIVRKARPDFLIEGRRIVDVKTTTDASPAEFLKQIARFKYHVSAAYYLDVVSSVTGHNYDEFLIVAVEKTAPYGVAVYQIEPGAIDDGRLLYKKALNTLKECRNKNEWPAYADSVQHIALPPWAYSEAELNDV